MAMTGAQALMAEGRREGRREGHVELVIEQLEAKFGDVSADVRTRLEALSDREVLAIGRRLITARTIDELGI